MMVIELGILFTCTVCMVFDYLIYKYVRMEYEESKAGNNLLKRLMLSRKRSRVKAVIKELAKADKPE